MTAPTKKVWSIGDRAYVLVGSRALAVTIDKIGTGGCVHAKHGRYEGLWVHTRRLRTDRLALDVTALERQLRSAVKDVMAAERDSVAADKRERRALSMVTAIEDKLAAAKARVAK